MLPFKAGTKGFLWCSLAASAGLGLAYQPAEGSAAPSPPRHVLLISIDTLRADHCGFLGYGKPTTPFLDKLAAAGVVFTDHRVHSNNTLQSHTSILTGLIPRDTVAFEPGLTESADPIGPIGGFEPSAPTLAEAFQSAGYTTAAFTGHPVWLGADYGLDRGFDVHESDWVLAPETTQRFLSWLDDAQPERMFAFLHFYDVHSEASSGPDTLPYDSTPELIASFAGPRPKDWTGRARGNPAHTASRYLNMVSHGIEKLGPGHLEYVVGLYDAGLRKLDDDLRFLFEQLAERGVLEDALIVFTSDHGESLGERGRMLHDTLADEVTRVPLVVVAPNRFRPAGQRIDERSLAVDIAPTLLDFVGAGAIGEGSSLLPAILHGSTGAAVQPRQRRTLPLPVPPPAPKDASESKQASAGTAD